MNERINALIEQATTKESFYPSGCDGRHEDRYDFDKQKFAELLVKECMKVANDHDLGLDIVSTHIKEHFGIE